MLYCSGNLEAGVLLARFFLPPAATPVNFDIAGVGRDSIKQGFTLIAVTLVAHIEDLSSGLCVNIRS